MIFPDRINAGRCLAEKLAHLRGEPNLLVLAMPRGGIPLALEIARELCAPLDLCMVRKIGAPENPEFAVGSVAETGPPFVEEQTIRSMRIPFAYVRDEAAFQQKELTLRAMLYRGARTSVEIGGKTVILVDDGVATGATARAALQSVRYHVPARLIFATPVADSAALQRLAKDADELVILSAPLHLTSVSSHYQNFPQVTDEEVIAALNERA